MMKVTEIRTLLHELCDHIVINLPKIQAQRYNITLKQDGTPVTQADLYVESLVVAYVKERIPQIRFISEEGFSTDMTSVESNEYLAVLDPIDGTENFCSGLVEWGVSFGIWFGEEHLGSFLLFPEMGIRLVSGDVIEPIRSRLVGVSSSIAESVIEQFRGPHQYRMMGSAAYNLYNVVRGAFCQFVNPKGAYVWDLLPGMMLALEHGCTVFANDEPFTGGFLEPNQLYRVHIISRSN